MGEDHGTLMLLGSVARPEDGWEVEDVLRRSAQTLGPYVSMLPDGELGDRSQWITYLARHTYSRHPDLLTLSRHTFEDWKPRNYNDQWRLAVREGVEEIRFDTLGYAEEAKRSYEVFGRLRDEGVIGRHVRFLVAFPLIESATRAFVNNGHDFEILWEAYRDAATRDIQEITATIPHEDLALQWDIARETAAIEGLAFNFAESELAGLPADPMERYCRALAELAPAIASDVWLGLHVCYGSLEHKPGQSADSGHHTPIRDLNVAVDMLNRGVRACGRTVEFVHMPVRFSDGLRDDFYAPLERLDVGSARVYLGLIDSIDGVQGALDRAGVARRHLRSFGLATACGWGRRPLSESVQDLLDLERRVADALAAGDSPQATIGVT
jgi:hypothetical protein